MSKIKTPFYEKPFVFNDLGKQNLTSNYMMIIMYEFLPVSLRLVEEIPR